MGFDEQRASRLSLRRIWSCGDLLKCFLLCFQCQYGHRCQILKIPVHLRLGRTILCLRYAIGHGLSHFLDRNESSNFKEVLALETPFPWAGSSRSVSWLILGRNSASPVALLAPLPAPAPRTHLTLQERSSHLRVASRSRAVGDQTATGTLPGRKPEHGAADPSAEDEKTRPSADGPEARSQFMPAHAPRALRIPRTFPNCFRQTIRHHQNQATGSLLYQHHPRRSMGLFARSSVLEGGRQPAFSPCAGYVGGSGSAWPVMPPWRSDPFSPVPWTLPLPSPRIDGLRMRNRWWTLSCR